MANEDNDEVIEARVRERLRRTDVIIEGNIFPGSVTGRLTEDGLNMLMDSLTVGGFKVVKK